MFSYIDSLFSDPKGTLIFLLLALPGRLMAISAHEFAHAWVANKCGDPTARQLGRLTLNPVKHLDLIGTLMMVFVGFGWAKPVPVNPRNFREYRKDDLLVSLAGVTMNLLLFIFSSFILCLAIVFALRTVPHVSNWLTSSESLFVTDYLGESCLMMESSYFPVKSLFLFAPYVSDMLITPVFGRLAGYAYQMLSYFALVNIVLAVFNLLPVPPLDGYHVVNDLLVKRSLFASERTARICMGLLMVLMFTGILGKGLGYVQDWAISGMGTAFHGLFHLNGLI